MTGDTYFSKLIWLQKKLFTQIFIYFSKPLRLYFTQIFIYFSKPLRLYFTQIFIYFSKPLRLLYSLIIYEIVNFSFFTLYSLLLLSFFLYLKSVPIYVIVHDVVHLRLTVPEPEDDQNDHQSHHCSQREDDQVLHSVLAAGTPQTQHAAYILCQYQSINNWASGSEPT